jgi:hypothetical protein
VQALAAHLTLLLDAGVRAGLSERARAAVLPLSPSAMTLKLVLLYKELLEASVARRGTARGGPAAANPAAAVGTAQVIAPAEAAPLHGEDGLGSETLPSGHAPPPSDVPPPPDDPSR